MVGGSLRLLWLLPLLKLVTESGIKTPKINQVISSQTKDCKIGICCFSTKHAERANKAQIEETFNYACK
jgi:D-serine deaminase-like pyridoxal phosphate-dependent protein